MIAVGGIIFFVVYFAPTAWAVGDAQNVGGRRW